LALFVIGLDPDSFPVSSRRCHLLFSGLDKKGIYHSSFENSGHSGDLEWQNRGVCVNSREESSHGHWGYVKALGSCCDPGSVHRAVSVKEKKEEHQLLDKFPVLKRPH
jgi:hypothetical protein